MTPDEIQSRAAALLQAGFKRRAINCWHTLAAMPDATDAERDKGYRMANMLAASPARIKEREQQRNRRRQQRQGANG